MKGLVFVLIIFNSLTIKGQLDKMQAQKIPVPKNYFNAYYADSIPKLVDGKLYTGVDTTVFVLGGEKLKAIEYFKDGLKSEVKTFYDNGQPECYYQFKNGKREGISRKWYKNGNVMFDYTIKDGKTVGSLLILYEDGHPKSFSNEQTGLYMEFFKNGKISHLSKPVESSVKCPENNGSSEIYWYENGQLQEQSTMNCGKQLFKLYANDSTPVYEGTIITMSLYRVGTFTEYYNSGKVKLQGAYKDADNTSGANIKTGVWKYWTENGKLQKEEQYENNKLIKTKEFIKEEPLFKINDKR